MTAKELAAALTGCEVGMEIMPGEEQDAKTLVDIFRRHLEKNREARNDT